MSRCDLFVPQELAPQMAKCLGSLSGLSLKDQLARRKILRVVIKEMSDESKAYLMAEHGGFSVLLGFRRRMFWSVDLGHEIAHTFFLIFPEDSLKLPYRTSPRVSWSQDWEEVFCDWFGWQWAIAGNNHKETMQLLSSAETNPIGGREGSQCAITSSVASPARDCEIFSQLVLGDEFVTKRKISAKPSRP